ncbi:MAG: lysylphosphatidylglycerol synthase transmembrane domain-containing protein [Kofleriaceae bacterium]
MTASLKLALRIVAILAIGAGLWFFVRKIDLDALGTALRDARPWPLFLVVGFAFLCLFGKAASWRIMFWPRYRISTLRLFRYTIASYAASTIAPARAGEVLRVWALKRRDGVPAADTAAVAVAQKLLDAVTLVVLVAPVPWMLEGLPSWVGTGILLAASGSLALCLGLWVAVGRVRADASSSALKRFIAGMHVLRDPRRLGAAFVVLTLVWISDLTMVNLSLYAVGIDLPIVASPLILFTLCLAITLPSTPAQIGAHQVGAMAALDLLHVAPAPALAFALLYHALQVVPWLIAGLILELPLVLGRIRTDTPVESDAVDHAAPHP